MAKVITFGEIMLRLATPGYLRFNQAKQFEATFGGGEANVAVSLANYGLEAEFVTRFQKKRHRAIRHVSPLSAHFIKRRIPPRVSVIFLFHHSCFL